VTPGTAQCDVNYSWLLTSRNKRSLALDLTRPDGREVLVRLVKTADVFVTNYQAPLLAKFRLAGDAALRPAAGLSPGERTRAALALLQARGVNCLVLDEPTNHLDLEAIEQLELALADYPGTLIIVTHDRRLADAVQVDRVIDVRTLQGRSGNDDRCREPDE